MPFCDLVGSTELAARLDPEDMSALIRAYQNTVAGEITRFEGHIAKYILRELRARLQVSGTSGSAITARPITSTARCIP